MLGLISVRKHPYYLNGRLLYIIFSQLFLAALYLTRNIMTDRFAVKWKRHQANVSFLPSDYPPTEWMPTARNAKFRPCTDYHDFCDHSASCGTFRRWTYGFVRAREILCVASPVQAALLTSIPSTFFGTLPTRALVNISDQPKRTSDLPSVYSHPGHHLELGILGVDIRLFSR